MNRFTLVVFVFLICLTFFSSKASSAYTDNLVVQCNNCTALDMQGIVAQMRYSLPNGFYRVVVLDWTNINIVEFSLVVEQKKNPDDAVPIMQHNDSKDYILQLPARPNFADAKIALQDLKTTFDEFSSTLYGPVVLPANSPYKSAAEALKYQEAFSVYMTSYMSNHDSFSLNAQKYRAALALMASYIEVSAVVVSASISMPASLSVKFKDGTTIVVNFSFSAHAGTLRLLMTATREAYTADNKLIPGSVLEVQNFQANPGTMSAPAFVAWVQTLDPGIRMLDFNPEPPPACFNVKIDCGVGHCKFTYVCD